jgi:hypothetical protein
VGSVGHLAELRGRVRNTFSWSSESVQLCWVSVKSCHVWRLPAESVRRPVQEAYVLCVSSFPCRVYIYSNHRDSRI